MPTRSSIPTVDALRSTVAKISAAIDLFEAGEEAPQDELLSQIATLGESLVAVAEDPRRRLFNFIHQVFISGSDYA